MALDRRYQVGLRHENLLQTAETGADVESRSGSFVTANIGRISLRYSLLTDTIRGKAQAERGVGVDTSRYKGACRPLWF